MHSLRSRVTNISARVSQVPAKQADGRLSKIEEADGENKQENVSQDGGSLKGDAEVEDLDPCEEIAGENLDASLDVEEPDVDVVDAWRNDGFDEVSAYRGTILHGIGLVKDGPHYRKLGDELGIQKKRAFDKTHHALSSGFEELAMPAGKEIVKIEKETR